MGNGIRIARLFGIEIEIQPSWFLILALFVWSFATSWFGDSGWSTATVWSVAVVTALLLFASVLLHELAHSLVARAQGIRVRSISLFLLGGVSTLEEEASSPGREALMAAAGPGASAAVAAITWFAAGAIPGPEQLVAMLVALAWINAVLTVFNLLPGFPLDGGRVLRALVWKLTGDRARATRIAAGAGLVVGWLLIAGGALMAFTGSLGGGIWTAFIGWTMVQAAKAIGPQSRTGGAASAAGARFSGVTVAALMTPPRGWAPGSATVDRAAEERGVLRRLRRPLPAGGRRRGTPGGRRRRRGVAAHRPGRARDDAAARRHDPLRTTLPDRAGCAGRRGADGTAFGRR
jgi:Zn-dependent protease